MEKIFRKRSKQLIGVWCLCLLLSACSSNPEKTVDPLGESTASPVETITDGDIWTNPSAMHQSTSIPGSFVETEYGSYYLNGQFLYYSDPGEPNYVKLCGRPDCSHDSEDCNAYLDASSFTYYVDAVYYYLWSDSGDKLGIELWRMQADGSGHEKVKDILEATGSSLAIDGFFHLGYLYYTDGPLGISTSGVQGSGLYRIALDDRSSPEKLLEASDIAPYYTLDAYQDRLYLTGINDNGQTILSSVDLNSMELRPLSENWSLYGSYFTSETAFCYIPEDGFYELDLKSLEQKQVAPVALAGEFGAYYYPDYIYLFDVAPLKEGEGARKLYIYNRDYELVAETELSSEDFSQRDPCFLAATKDNILFVDLVKWPSSAVDSYIAKTDIGTGTLTIHEVNDAVAD